MDRKERDGRSHLPRAGRFFAGFLPVVGAIVAVATAALSAAREVVLLDSPGPT